MTSRFAVVAVLALSLAACGSNEAADEAPAPAETAVPGETAMPDAAPSETPDATETEAVEAEATPSPTPTASATPTPTPTPTKVAVAGPPDAFKQCAVCHKTTPGDNLIGPSLAGIYGEKAGDVPGFKFSEAMKNSGLTWNEATLDRYLADPKGVVPGTTMAFAGVKDAGKRADIIAYLKTL